MKTQPETERCPVEFTIETIGGKYKPLLLWHLQQGKLRFSELRRQLPRATAKMLTQHLRELERDGLVRREVFPVVPPRVEYSLTATGKSVMPVLQAMCDWGLKHRNQPRARVQDSARSKRPAQRVQQKEAAWMR